MFERRAGGGNELLTTGNSCTYAFFSFTSKNALDPFFSSFFSVSFFFRSTFLFFFSSSLPSAYYVMHPHHHHPHCGDLHARQEQ